IQPPGHPGAARLIVPCLAGHRAATCSLPALAEEDFGVSRDDGAKVGWIPVLPMFLPSELLEPDKALLKVRDVQNGSHVVDDHWCLRTLIALPNGSRLSSGRKVRRRTTGILPYLRAPVSFKRLLGSRSDGRPDQGDEG